jgi:peptide/nickel transport system substrate-binding protein
MLLYALHDATVKAMPGQSMRASLAESWSMSSDGLSYHFVLRQDAKFHNGDLVTAEDVKFSFERYRGTSAKILHDSVKLVEVMGHQRLRFVLKQPWADFMTFYATATGAAWVVPKKYVERVGEAGFKKDPIGAGPYKFASFVPGVELVLEAFEQYWRKPPSVKRLVFKVMPDESTRLAALRRGEVDIVYQVRGALAEELQRTPGFTLKPTPVHATLWLYFTEQWDPKSPWHDRRVRLAVNHAINWQAINQAENLGHSKVTGSIIPSTYDFYWQPPPPAYDSDRARQLLAAAGFPSGFDAGDYFCDVSFASLAEAIVSDLRKIGIRTRIRSLERAALYALYANKKSRGLIQSGSGTAGNAATRLEAFVIAGGAYAYGSHPDIDALFREQAAEREQETRERILHRIQQLVHERAMFAPIWEHVLLNGVGPRVEESGLGRVAGHPYSAPYEDLTVKGR